MDEITSNLKYDFYYLLNLFNTVVRNLSVREKNLAIAWVNKLKTSAASVEEAQIRNDILFYLLKSCETGKLSAPFDQKPQAGPLLSVFNVMPKPNRESNKSFKQDDSRNGKTKAEIFRRSPDGGAFLAAQPVPRCGAFCYLAVISKPPEK